MTTATDLKDIDEITKVIQHYIDGAKSGKGNDMKPAFHDEATIYGYVGPDLFGGPIQGLFDWNDNNGPAKDIQTRIVNINIINTIASVQLESDNWTGHRFTDLFNLVKFGGKWKVVSKVFHLHG
jgi:hypothetical protein